MSDVINSFPGYEFVQFKDGTWHNMYRGTDLGFGGYVYAEPGMYGNVALLDVASMHPTSIVMLNKLGKYTNTYADLLMARIYIKHRDYESASKLFNGKLIPYLTDDKKADELSKALKLPLNSFYGISFSKYETPARDSRDRNNIIALRGALFMRTLQDEITARGFSVVHIKTDSVKIADATPEIIEFVKDFGKKYGYEMEHEATYERMCLVNDAVYIAKYDECGIRNKGGKKANKWTATGAQFQVPYVFKTLFTKEEIIFDDLCETKSVSGDSAIYVDMNEGLPDVSEYEKELEKIEKELKKLWGSEWKKQLEIMADVDVDTLEAMYRIDANKIQESNDLVRRHWKLEEEMASGHDYIFVGRVGRFTPIKEGCGGGVLYRKKDGKYYAVTGTKGFRWLESEMVKALGKEDCIDYRYYDELVDETVETIRKYGMIEDERHGVKDWFFTDIPYKHCTYTNGIPDRYYQIN